MLLLLTGCAFWFGEADLAPYPVTRADLLRPEPAHVSGALPPTMAPPSVRSVAPEPLLLDLSPTGYPQRVELGELEVPEAFAWAFTRAAGGTEGGVPVEAVIERFQVLCLADAEAGIDAGAHVVVEGAVRFGEGPWRAVEVTGHGQDCDLADQLYENAGAAFAGEVVALAATADLGTPLPPLPPVVGTPTMCVATDARPPVERRGQRIAESLSFLTVVGQGYLAERGTRVRGRVSDAKRSVSSREAEALSQALRRALDDVFPGIQVGGELCLPEPYANVDTPTVWVRLDHAFVEQYVRASEWTTSTQVGAVAVTTTQEWGGATAPFAYWRAGIALCVGGVCRGTTVAGTQASTDLWEDAGPTHAWDRLALEALLDLTKRARGVVAGWVGQE